MDQLFNLYDYELAARDCLSTMAYQYYQGGAGDAQSRDRNRTAYADLTLWPRVGVDVSQRDLRTSLLGQSLAMPLLIAPTAMAALAHSDKELGIARAVRNAGLAMTTSTLSTTSIEELSTTGARLWFQLYIHKDRGLTRSLVQRAEASGCEALVITVDVPVIGYREYMMRHPLALPNDLELANLVDYWDRERYPLINQYVAAQFDPSVTWRDIEALASTTKLPVVVKGILRADDARQAVVHGASAIIVSNHGGRQLDGVPATISALPYVADAVGHQCEVLVDGGIRRGTDILKALAAGARAVLIGRPVLWGLAVNGEAGVTHVLDILRREYDIALALGGVTSSAAVSKDLLEP